MFKRYKLKNYNFKLIIFVILITYLGIMAIGSAEESLKSTQMLGFVAGLVIMLIVSFIDYNFVLNFYWLAYIANFALLLMVILFGVSSHNAKRWVYLGPIRFQPSETAKILLILFFAQFIMKYREKINSFKFLCICCALFAVPLALILKQPDLSTSIVLIIVFCSILYAGGISFKIILGVLAVAIPAFVLAFYLLLNSKFAFLQGYQMNRINAFLYPDDYPELVYQQENSVMAIGSGMLDGKGYKNNEIYSVKNGNFISEAQTDFIFAVIGEEFGFKGTAAVIVLLFLIALECLKIARKAKDTGGAIIGTAVGTWIGFQSFFNIGVATWLLPNTGLTLPFVSYGLTSLLSLYMAIGFVLNVSLQQSRMENKSKGYLEIDF